MKFVVLGWSIIVYSRWHIYFAYKKTILNIKKKIDYIAQVTEKMGVNMLGMQWKRR